MYKTMATVPRGRRSRGFTRSQRSQARGSRSTADPLPHLTIFPEELWREIFLHCLPTDEFIVPSRTSAPLLLCQVCRAWRASAIAVPDLWASISIGSHFDALGSFPRIELVNIWLLRARALPLSISYGRFPSGNGLAEYLSEDGPDEEEVHEVFDNLVGHIARWKSLRLYPKDVVKRSLPPIPQSGAPLLQKLCLFLRACDPGNEYDFSNSDQRLCDIWRNSPLLNTFSFLGDLTSFGEYAESLCTSLRMQWDRVTTLTITPYQSITECLELLAVCPNLVYCAFDCIFEDEFRDYEDDLSALYPTPIHLTKLTSLALCHYGPAPSAFITHLLLANITTPALRRLIISGEEVFAPDLFEAFIRRSSCHIEDFTLFGVFINDDSLLHCLELHSRTLASLCIRNYGPGSIRVISKCMSDAVLKRLTRDESESPADAILCPKLESIDLDYRMVEAQDGLFSKMVSSRHGMEEYGIRALKSVVLRLGDETDMDRSQDVSALRQLREEGVLEELRVEKIG